MAKKSMSFQIIGVNKTIATLARKDIAVKNAIKVGIRQATLYTEGEVKESIAGRRGLPVTVDTGRFMRSPESKTSATQGIVSSDLEYAPALEFGTSRMHARPHFKNTAAKNKIKIQKLIQDKIGVATKL